MKTRACSVLVAGVILLASPALGDASGPRSGGDCPATIDAPALCNEVNDMLQAPSLPGLRYNYQERIRTAACVESADAPQVVQAKIQDLWKRRGSSLTCNLMGFSVRNGSILKLAVEKNSRDFLNDAVRRWKVDLNQVDASDGRTVLDYVSDEREKVKGTSNEAVMQRYYEMLRREGARHRREL